MTTKADKQVEREARAALEALGGKHTSEDDVVFEGSRFQIPEYMSLAEGAEWLSDRARAENESMSFSRSYEFKGWDGAYAVRSVARKIYGGLRQEAQRSLFGSTPPRMVTIPGPDGEIEVPWGAFSIPGIDVNFQMDGGANGFAISAVGPKRERFAVNGFFEAVATELEENSLYRGRAFDGADMPNFLDTKAINPDDIIYSGDVRAQLEASVWAPIRHTQAHRDLGLPIKRAVLLEGPYGTGKTEFARLTAKVCSEPDNDWTFIYVRPGKDKVTDAIATAQKYAPCAVFVEDIDALSDAALRRGSDGVSALLDLFDGLEGKGSEIMLVLTTNHADRIHKGMVRPGRLDAVIHVGGLDRDGVEALAKRCVPNLKADVDYDKVYEATTGFMPAFLKEAFDRSLRYSLARNNGVLRPIGTDELVDAANGLRSQLELMEGAPEGRSTEAEFVESYRALVRSAVHEAGIVDDDGDTVLTVDTEGSTTL